MVQAFSRVSDVHVFMTIERPRPLIGLGNMLILHKKTADTPAQNTGNNGAGTQELTEDDIENGIIFDKTDSVSGANYREYLNTDAVAVDYEPDTDVLNKATYYFSQKAHSDRVAVLTYPDGKLADALKAFWYNNWVFAIFAEAGLDDAKSVSNIFEANQDRMLFVQATNVSNLSFFKGQSYTSSWQTTGTEAIDAAIIGTLANETVGLKNWKGKTLTGITARDITSNERSALERANVNAYINVGGIPETSSGVMASGEYIDSIHGDIWIKSNIEGALQHLLTSSNKIPYNQSGINLIVSTVNTVLEKAYVQGIIQENDATQKGIYTVEASPRDEQPQADLSKRHYGGLKFSYKRAGAIEDITVNGTIQTDTILSA